MRCTPDEVDSVPSTSSDHVQPAAFGRRDRWTRARTAIAADADVGGKAAQRPASPMVPAPLRRAHVRPRVDHGPSERQLEHLRAEPSSPNVAHDGLARRRATTSPAPRSRRARRLEDSHEVVGLARAVAPRPAARRAR